jgi:hypothetical protein
MATFATSVDPGQFVTATATDPAGNTSAFSAGVVVNGRTSPNGGGARFLSLGFEPAGFQALLSPTPLTAPAGFSDGVVQHPVDSQNMDSSVAGIPAGMADFQSPVYVSRLLGVSERETQAGLFLSESPSTWNWMVDSP